MVFLSMGVLMVAQSEFGRWWKAGKHPLTSAAHQTVGVEEVYVKM